MCDYRVLRNVNTAQEINVLFRNISDQLLRVVCRWLQKKNGMYSLGADALINNFLQVGGNDVKIR